MTSSKERATYWRVPGLALEAMDAHFERYAYPMHAHDTYSFGVTDDGAQSFVCRGGWHVSAAGLVMAFNPDDPHDGQSAVPQGHRYRMLHLGEDLVRDVITDAAPGTAGLPLFDTPVVDSPALTQAVARLPTAVAKNAPRLVTEERLTATVLALSRRAATRPVTPPDRRGRVDLAAMARVRGLLR
ncbi:AraC family ligand binding domain-containing protein [Nonomuraea indica]|uniref:AraC family ligand binding domain-containing protein n=1 Tax=Nonomuraea indica TaxID=1581193 RepID=A0ABW8AEM3_9ACTN